MNSYFAYLSFSILAIADPGTGVVMTLTNSLNFGLKTSIYGIFGISLGMFIVSIIAGGGIGVVIANSNLLYFALKILGAIYLLYFGLSLIKTRNKTIDVVSSKTSPKQKKLFIEGVSITITNPKAIIFFVSLFPQFIDSEANYLSQFTLLSLTFCFLILLIHIIYGTLASFIKSKLTGFNYFKYVNIAGGCAYIIFALKLLDLHNWAAN